MPMLLDHGHHDVSATIIIRLYYAHYSICFVICVCVDYPPSSTSEEESGSETLADEMVDLHVQNSEPEKN